jgi:hypothetical protein
LRHLLSRFKRCFTKPQYRNFCRTMLGLIAAGKGEHDVKSINELFIDRKDQSSLNRFITEPKWSIDEVVREGRALLLSEAGELDESVEIKVIDDTVCRKYSARTEMVCYNHSSTMGTVLSHDYVTSLYVNDGLALPDGLKLYGNEKRCGEKGVEFKTKVQLACEMMDEHTPRAKRTIWLWDSWFTCHDTVAGYGAHGYSWICEVKGNRIGFYGGRKYHLNELLDRMRSEGRFMDATVDGEIYQACKVDDVFIPKIGHVSIVIDAKASTRDVHLLCTDLADCSLEEIVQHALHRHKIDDFHKEAKSLGLGEYRFRESEAALIHAHLVSLAFALLDALRRRLLRYSIVKRLLSVEATVEWVRKRTMHLFIHKVRDAKLPIRSILRMIDTS